jgi:bifunctional UDP-N-acetylglucosamine pyrophosphorylase/glucosamine-1-phosphate N-acetyltransferase
VSQDWVGIVLAAGQGTRMKSATPKVLHAIAGRPLVAWAVGAALEAGARECVVVVGHGRDAVKAALHARFGERVRFAVQEEQNGTGHAVRCALEQALPAYDGSVVISYGDCPLLTAETLRRLVHARGDAPLALVTATLPDPTGYGRMIRKDGRVIAIREHKDCNETQRAIREVNPGLYAIDATFLREAIAGLDTNNAQGELYLTDVVAAAAKQAHVADVPGDMSELRGVNDRYELALCGEVIRRRIAETLARSGVGVIDPATTYVDADCVIEPDVTLEPNVHLRGACVVRAGAHVETGCVLTNVLVDEGAHLKPYSVATDSRIGPRADVGPFTHLRPQTELHEGAKVGNFCETKKTIVGPHSKVNHLAYVGDGILGEGVNVGAGTIFCNYDGFRKHTTILEDGAFIGSDSQLVAPVRIGKGAYVASGSTITKDVPDDGLAMSRTKQVNKEGYASKLKARFAVDAKKKPEHG